MFPFEFDNLPFRPSMLIGINSFDILRARVPVD